MIMNKKLNFLFLLSLLGLIFTGCSEDDGNAPSTPPTASFDFTANELVVTFNNTSTGASSYIWTFGDGNKSTDENPTHTYAADGSYDVELFATNSADVTKTIKKTVTVKVKVDDDDDEEPTPTFSITLDGEFDDWNDIPEEHLAIAILDAENSDYHRLKEVRLIADASYIYMYMKLDTLYGNAMDIYLNVDGDTETGYNSWMWNAPSANYLMQGFKADNYDMRLAAYDESKGGGWGWLTPNVVDAGTGLMEISEMNEVEENIVEFEAQILRNFIPGLGDEVRIMIGHSGAEGDAWTTSGGLPTVTNAGDKNDGLLLRLK